MRFSFASPQLPMLVRVCRALVWTQAAFVILAGVFVVFAATVFGTTNSIPFHGDTLSGSRAAILGVVYIVAGIGLTYLGIALGRLQAWSRTVIVCAQVFLAVLLFFRSPELSLSTVINVFFYASIIGLVFAPEVRRAFEAPAVTPPLAGAAAPATDQEVVHSGV